MAPTPTRRARLMMAACIIHLIAIGSFATVASFTRKRPPSEQTIYSPLFSALKLYTIYTALAADYGFFSPEIGSSHEMEIEVVEMSGKTRRIDLKPANREVSV